MTPTTLNVPAIREIDFSAEPMLVPDGVRVKLLGEADGRVVAALTQFLPTLHDEVTAIGVTSVVVDFVELEFMNSSCFKAFVTWISTVQELENPYKIKLLSNPAVLWQRRSLHALASFAAEVISVEAVSPE